MTVTRIVHYRARPGVEEALHNALLEAVPSIANSPGCVKVRMLPSLDDGAEFALYEEWTSIEARRAAVGVAPTLLAKINALLAAPAKSSFYAG